MRNTPRPTAASLHWDSLMLSSPKRHNIHINSRTQVSAKSSPFYSTPGIQLLFYCSVSTRSRLSKVSSNKVPPKEPHLINSLSPFPGVRFEWCVCVSTMTSSLYAHMNNNCKHPEPCFNQCCVAQSTSFTKLVRSDPLYSLNTNINNNYNFYTCPLHQSSPSKSSSYNVPTYWLYSITPTAPPTSAATSKFGKFQFYSLK